MRRHACLFLRLQAHHCHNSLLVQAEMRPVSMRHNRVANLQAVTEKHICSDDPWLVLHKIDSPTKLRHIGQVFARCPYLGP